MPVVAPASPRLPQMAYRLPLLQEMALREGTWERINRAIRERLRRLMRNCGRRGRSRNLMLAPNLLPKAVPHNGSRLLLGFIVRPDRRLVESQPPLGHTPPWPS